MLTRRQFVKAGVVAGSAVFVPSALRLTGAAATAVPGGTLDPTAIAKYVTPLPIMPVMPRAGTADGGGVDLYTIGVRRFRQQVLPAGMPRTTLFGYGSAADGSTFRWPSRTIEARANRPVRVTYVNQLVDGQGRFLPHLLTVDPTLHWANPVGGTAGRDSRPEFTGDTPGPYTGPVPLVTHLHGGHVREEADGYPEAWYLPTAANIPSGFATVGSFYDRFKAEFHDRVGGNWPKGAAIFQYPNDQRATTLWFHDHTLGMTRLNIYAGVSGFYLIRGGPADLPAGVLPSGRFEIPLMLQDRSFNTDGSLFFPADRAFFGDVPAGGPYVPQTDVPPMWNPEFFGNTIVVNGATWPVLNVEARRYRLRIVNASNTRFYMLKIVTNPTAPRPAKPAMPFFQIGSDGGFLPRVVRQDRLLVHVAERNDVIVDFSKVKPGTELFLINEGPDEPFGGGEPGTDFDPADVATTGQVMKFVVHPRSADVDTSVDPDALPLPAIAQMEAATNTRVVSLNELDSTLFPDAPTVGMLGTVNADGTGNPLGWHVAPTEKPPVNSTEIWELHNFTEDGHPIHIHQIQFQVVNRQPFDNGAVRPPEAGEHGFKDTVVALPKEITRVRTRFDIPGRYVWHCHIIDHEDNGMMRPLVVT